MNFKVNEESCIGCGTCFSMCEEVFEMNDEGLASVKEDADLENFKDEAITAMESCPTGAIVTNEN